MLRNHSSSGDVRRMVSKVRRRPPPATSIKSTSSAPRSGSSSSSTKRHGSRTGLRGGHEKREKGGPFLSCKVDCSPRLSQRGGTCAFEGRWAMWGPSPHKTPWGQSNLALFKHCAQQGIVSPFLVLSVCRFPFLSLRATRETNTACASWRLTCPQSTHTRKDKCHEDHVKRSPQPDTALAPPLSS
jgi:hypothetical protein